MIHIATYIGFLNIILIASLILYPHLIQEAIMIAETTIIKIGPEYLIKPFRKFPISNIACILYNLNTTDKIKPDVRSK